MQSFNSDRNVKACFALLLAVLLASTSCVELQDDAPLATGFLAPVSVSFDVTVEDLTESKAPVPVPEIQKPSVDQIRFVVKDMDGNVKYSDYGLWTANLVVPVGKCTIEAVCGSNGFGEPYFHGSASVTVTPYEVEEVGSLTLHWTNSIVAVSLADDLGEHFTFRSLTLKSGSKTYDAPLGEYCFVPSGEPLSISLTGTNSAGQQSVFTHNLSSPSPKTACEVICGKASADWPSISLTQLKEEEAWASRIYITTPATFSGNISDENKAAVVYEAIPSSSSDWTSAAEALSENGALVIKGLTPGQEYQVRARVGALVSNVVNVTPKLDGFSATASHTFTDGELDGTDVTSTFSKPDVVKNGISSWSISLCKSDGTVLRSGLSFGTSDGSVITAPDGWPYLPTGSGEAYKLCASATMSDGEVITIEKECAVPETPEFSIQTKSYTSYDKYAATNGMSRNLGQANDCDPSTIYDAGAYWGISTNLMKNKNYAKTLVIKLNDDSSRTYNVKGEFQDNRYYKNITGCAWQAHSLTVSVTFDGKTCSETRTHHITGLPYNIDFRTSSAGWNLYDKCSCDGDGLHFDPVATPYANLLFHVPNNIDVSLYLYAGVQLNATSAISIAHLDVKIGSTNNDKVLTAPSKFAGGKTTTTAETLVTGALSTSSKSVELKTNSLVSGMWVIVPGVRLVYR